MAVALIFEMRLHGLRTTAMMEPRESLLEGDETVVRVSPVARTQPAYNEMARDPLVGFSKKPEFRSVIDQRLILKYFP